MVDREKLIEDIEQQISEPTNEYVVLWFSEAEYVLELLKEHDATMVIESENMYTGLPITHCPKCGKSLDRFLYGRQHEGKINFCPYCGKAVIWE